MKLSYFNNNTGVQGMIQYYALETPNKIALIFEDQSLTYKELDKQSSNLAWFLQQQDVGVGDFVALYLKRSLDLIVGILAIQKAGAAYVPIDFDYPAERMAFMIADSGAKVILTHEAYQSKLPNTKSSIIALDMQWTTITSVAATKHYQDNTSRSDLAYMIYTSGSTGKPKGVMITHDNIFNQLEGQHNIAPTPIDKMLLTCSISFDVSVLTIYWTFYHGATLVVPLQGEEKDIQQLSKTIARHQITHILTLPSLHTLILGQADPDKLQSLKLVNVSGEVCPTSLAQRHEALLPNCQLYNLYGPTEATVNCTYFTFPKGFDAPKAPIGRPIDNYEMFILNDQMEEVAIGELGTIYIGGSKPVVGKGYWNRPQLSAERFIKNPFQQSRGGEVLYNTGDLGKWMSDGNIEFLGRSDFQVKFRGFRIELGEIEVAISRYDLVKEVVVLLKNKEVIGQQRLVAYVTLNEGNQLNVSDIRSFLEATLPEYMLPTNFVVLAQFPLTPNGKFDRKALPDPPKDRPQLAQRYQAPKTPLEKRITAIWEQLLAIDSIGRNDKFFELGGNSIQAAQFIGTIQKSLKTSIFVTTIFDFPTVASYAKMLEERYGSELKASQIVDASSRTTAPATKNKLSESTLQSITSYFPTLTSFDTSIEKNPPAIFILAPPRSGTSLLRLMLAGHPKLLAVNELKLLGFHDLKERNTAYTGKFSLWQEGAIRVVMELKNCDAEAARLIINDFEKKGYTTKQFYRQLQEWAGDQIIVDKTPSYALDLKALQKAEQDFENAIFIHLVRHPSAMVPSFEKYRMDQVVYVKDHPFSAQELGEMIWYNSHQNITTFLKDIPTNRKFELRYEDLVQSPEALMQSLCKQIQLDFHPGLLQPYENIENKLVDGIHKDSRSMSDSNLRKHKTINADKANDWKKTLKTTTLSDATIELSEQLGYTTSIPSTQPTATNNASTASQKLEGYAIVGMSCRLPGANTLGEFWQNLTTGVDVGKVVTGEDLAKAGLDPALLNNPNYVARSYSLDHADCFDASFFGYHPKEAKQMDPQHRVLLETAYSCLENAGYDPYAYKGKIGIFGGVARNAYFTNNIATHPDMLANAGEYAETIGTEKSFSITRVAYKLNLKGPAVNVQTACSSSGTAVHMACQSLDAGDADMVLVAGGRIQPPLGVGYMYTEGGPLSPEGYIRAFDADAQGMVRGNGMACIVLKKLEKAVQDKDHIWAIIKGTGINNDGANKIGFTAPSIQGQADAISQALTKAVVQAEDIDYIEAHGTGTILGDPIEVAALTQAFRKSTNKNQFCGIGSVKTAVGHLDAGACVTGIIKTALALKNEAIPPNLNYQQPNAQINFKDTPFYVNARLKDWKKGNRIRRAGVSSFGLGGTNVHVVLEEAPVIETTIPSTEDTADIVLLSAKTEVALAKKVEVYQVYLNTNKAFTSKEIAYTTAIGRSEFSYRKVLALNKDTSKQGKVIAKNEGQLKDIEEVVWMFPGGGAQYVEMARDLYTSYPVFKEVVDDCLLFLKVKEGMDIAPLLFPSSSADKDQLQLQLEKPSYALAALFSIEYALAQLWLHWGIQPTQMIGHSMGEYTAACIAGVFSKEDGLRLVTLRGRLFEQLKTEGAMLSVALSEKEAKTYLLENSSISVINKPDNCVVSGTESAINQIQQKLELAGIDCSRIHIKVAAHSAQIDPIIPEFEQFLQLVKFNTPTIPIISNLSGKWVADEEITSAKYWVNHLRNTVRFSDGLATILEEPNKVLIEVGPGQTLSTFVKQHPAKVKSHLVFPSIRHPKEKVNDQLFIQKNLAKLWVNGLPINWVNYYQGEAIARVPLPTYPFERKSYWIAPNKEKSIKISNPPTTDVTQTMLATPVADLPTSTLTINTTNTMSTVKRQTILIKEIKSTLFELSGLEPEEMDIDATFLELGFDSLFLSQAVIQFNNKFDLDISFRALFESTPTIEKLADFVDEELPADQFQPVEEVAPVVQPTATTPVALPATNVAASLMTSVPNTTTPLQDCTPQVANLVQQQLQLMQQQLLLLQGGGSPQVAQQAFAPTQTQRAVIAPTTPTTPAVKKKAEEKEIKIKRSIKGVTKKQNFKMISASEDLSHKQKTALEAFIKQYNAMTLKSKKQAIQHKKYYADPISVTGFNKLWKELVYQMVADKSKGSKIWDIDGNEYVDYVMSYGMALFGHMPDFIEKAVIEQIQKGNALDVLTPKATEIARMVCEISGMDRVTLANTGTEAVLATVRAARTYSGKDRIAVFDTDYHGLVGQFLLRGVHFKTTSKAMPSAPGIPKRMVEDTLVLDYDDPNVLDKLRADIKNLAAVVIEPVQAQNPHWQHHELIRAIRKITEENDVALIFDEIINGFRLAQRGAQAWFDVQADIVAYGKSISGGLPLAAIAGKEKYMQAFDGGLWQFGDDSRPEGAITYFASTYIKNPISVTAGHAAMTELIKQGPALQEELNKKTKEFASRVREIFLRLKAPYMIQGTSSMYMVKPIDANPLTRLFNYYLRIYGVNMRARPCFISTAHTQEDFEKTYKAIESALQDLFDADLIQPYEGEDLNYYYENLPNIADENATNASAASVSVAPPVGLLEGSNNEKMLIPLADGQEEIWLSHQFSSEAAAAYNIVTDINLKGNLDKEKLFKAIEEVVQRHESLRTTFSADGKTQTIHTIFDPVIIELSWKELTEIEQRVNLDQLRKAESTTTFDLEHGPLIRFIVVEKAEEDYELLINVHHIICDGWSLGIVTKELGEIYSKLVGAANNPLATPKRLTDYVSEKIKHKDTKKYKKDETFWMKRFKDKIPILDIPTDFPRTSIKSYPAGQSKLALDQAFYKRLQKAAAAEGTTPYIFIMAAFKCFLLRLAKQEEVIFGMAAAGHNLPGNANMVGHLINLLPIRSKLTKEQDFSSFLKEVRGNVLDGFDHQNYTFGNLVKKLNVQRAANRNTLISVAFNMDSPLGQMNYGGLEVRTHMIPKQFEIFDAFINLKPIDDRLDFEWTYNADLFTKDTINLRLEEFHYLLENIIGNTKQKVASIPMIPKAEKEQLIKMGKGKELDFPSHERLTTLFEQQVIKHGSKHAILSGDQSITYTNFNEKANQLAHFLKKEGLEVGQYVGLCMSNSIDMLIVIYGILKAGGVYVPIDPRNPKNRKELILEDAKCSFLIRALGVSDFLNFRKKHFVWEELEETLALENRHNLAINIPSTTEAYVIYTSGSTGQPKGVAIQHRNAINTLFGINEHLQLTSEEIVYSVSSMSFDMSIPDYFLTFIKGGTLILAEENTKKDGFALREELERFRPTFMQATPTTWKILLLSGWKGDAQLKIVAGGEGFSKELATKLLKNAKAVWNGYGPTETTIYTTYKEITDSFLKQKSYGEFAPIGRPNANVWTTILDEDKKPVPLGIPGELYIGGAGVTAGYLNRPNLTSEKYVRLCEDKTPFTHWYKTGDLVRYLPNGDIDFLGRIDTQVKIRGFRIELGEIEELLNRHPNIQQSIVNVVSEDSERKELVAYYQSDKGDLQEGDIKLYLKDKLPGYMVPSFYIKMDSFPQNTSLKIDRKALPKPNRTQLAQSHKYEAPRTPREKELAGFWQELLKVDQISIHDDFFDLGGHSLIAVELLSIIFKASGIKLPITSLFQNATIAKQAKLLETKTELEAKRWTSLVSIKSGGSKKPLYLIHGGGLHVLFYQSLVRHLDEDQPIYALQAKGLDGTSEPLETIESMATHYINEILDQNPEGPFHLAGYSLGGLIAFEMAKQLKEMGKEVGVVSLFDAVAKDNWADSSKLEKMLKKTGHNFSMLMKKPLETINYKSTMLKQRYQHFLGKVKVAYKDTDTQNLEEGLLPYGKKVYEKSIEAYWKYDLKPCDISVILFKAEDEMFYLKDPEFHGWKSFALEGVEVFKVPGNHYNMFDGPSTEKIASILQKYMDQSISAQSIVGKG